MWWYKESHLLAPEACSPSLLTLVLHRGFPHLHVDTASMHPSTIPAPINNLPARRCEYQWLNLILGWSTQGRDPNKMWSRLRSHRQGIWVPLYQKHDLEEESCRLLLGKSSWIHVPYPLKMDVRTIQALQSAGLRHRPLRPRCRAIIFLEIEGLLSFLKPSGAFSVPTTKK